MAINNVLTDRWSAKDAISHGRFSKPGAHCINPNSALRIFQRGGLRQTDHSMFAGTIGCDPGSTDQAYNRCHIYDSSATTLPKHLPDLVFQAEPYAFEIDGDGAIPVFFGLSDDGSLDTLDSGVIEGYIQAAESLHNLLDERFHFCGL
jgi:hypothetical protein